MENWNKISEEVVGMLIRVGMRPMERDNSREIEEDWEGSEVGKVEVKEVNELLLEAFKAINEIEKRGWIGARHLEAISTNRQNWDNFSTAGALSELESGVRDIFDSEHYKAYKLKLNKQELANKIENLKSGWLRPVKKVRKYLDGMNIEVNKLSKAVFKFKDMVKDFGLIEARDFLIELVNGLNNLLNLIYNIEKMRDDDGDWWRYEPGSGGSDISVFNIQEWEYINLFTRESRDSRESRESREHVEFNFNQELSAWLKEFGKVLNEMKEIGRGYNYDPTDLFYELKPILLEIHRKEYKFDIKSLFSSYFGGNYEGDAWDDKFGYKIWELYNQLIKMGIRKEYIFNLVKELEKLGIEKSTDIRDNFLLQWIKASHKQGQADNLLQVINEVIRIESIPAGEMAKIIVGDLHALQRLMDKNPKILEGILGIRKFDNSYKFIQEMRLAKELKKIEMRGEEAPESLKDTGKEAAKMAQKAIDASGFTLLEPEIKKVIFNFIMNDFDKMVCIDFMKKFIFSRTIKAEDLLNIGVFFEFYGKQIAPINLNLLRSGKLNKYYDFINIFDYFTRDLLNKVDIKNDEKLFNVLKRFKLIQRIFHNNELDRQLNEIESYQNLFISMLNSKWDLGQDVVNKLINVGLNQKIDSKMSGEGIKEMETIASYIGVNLNRFRNDLMEIRQILVNGSPIPSSMKEKIYRTDNDLNNLLNGELIGKYADKAEPKRLELFELNYDIGDGLRFQVLPDKSIEHFYVGAATQCCQRAGGPGESSMVDSFINGDAGVVVLRKGKEIISQSYFHYAEGEGGRGYILDNVESNMELVKKYGINLDNLYVNLAMKVKQDTGVDYFKCGTTYNKLNNSNFGTEKMKNDPRKFHPFQEDVYVDFDAKEPHLNLLAPKFEVKPVEMKKSASRRIRDIMKIAGRFYEMVKGMV